MTFPIYRCKISLNGDRLNQVIKEATAPEIRTLGAVHGKTSIEDLTDTGKVLKVTSDQLAETLSRRYQVRGQNKFLEMFQQVVASGQLPKTIDGVKSVKETVKKLSTED
jgi:hypothetical protein